MNSHHLKYKLLAKLSNRELKVLEYVGKKGDGAMVKDVRLITQSNNSTTNTLLYHLWDLNFLVRQNDGPNGSYLYYLPPWMCIENIQLALTEQEGDQTRQNELEEDESYFLTNSEFPNLLRQIESNQKQILHRLNELEALIH